MMAEEAWKQLRLARYRIPAPETMEMDVDPVEENAALESEAQAIY